jgi:hypothetical protein
MSYPADIFSRMYATEQQGKLYPKEEVTTTTTQEEDVFQTNIFK